MLKKLFSLVSVFALALFARAEIVQDAYFDFTTMESYNMWHGTPPEGASLTVGSDGLTAVNPEAKGNWEFQYFVGDWMNLTPGQIYDVEVVLSGSVAGTGNFVFGSWSVGVDNNLVIPAGEGVYKTQVACPTDETVHLVMQTGSYVGTIKVKSVKVTHDTACPPELNALLASGIVTKEQPWDNQVYYALETPLVQGKEYTLSVDLYGDADGAIPIWGDGKKTGEDSNSTQYGVGWGDYIVKAGEWTTTERNFTADNNLEQLNFCFGSANQYTGTYLYFKNFVIKEKDSDVVLVSSDFTKGLVKPWGKPGWHSFELKIATEPKVAVAETYTVYYNNGAKKWDKVYCYAWNDEGNNSWPGQEMTKGEGDIWSITLSDFKPTKVIFNNGQGGAGNQTEDLVFEDGKTYGDAAAPDPVYVYYNNTVTAWENVYVYAWNGGVNNGWPGALMTQGEDNIWSYGFTDFVPTQVIFNNGGNGGQTSDLDFEAGKTYGEATAGKVELYLRGAMNGWGTSTKFVTEDYVTYTLDGVNIAADQEFKIANDGWNIAYGYNDPIEFGVEYTLATDGGNMKLAKAMVNGSIVFNYATGKATFINRAPAATVVTDVLTNANTVKTTNTTYAEYKDVTINSDAVYFLQAAGGNSAIQLRSSNNNSGIVTTTSGGTLKKVTVTFNSNTSTKGDRTLDVYAKNTPYTSPSNLYGEDKGTLVASFTNKAADGTTYSYTFETEYQYIGLRSKSGAMYLDEVEIEWENAAGDAVAAPAFSPVAGMVKAGTEVTISCQTEGAVIYYTTDESEPTVASTKYTAPIAINDYTVIKAMAVADGTASKVVTAEYMLVPELEDLSPILDFPDKTPFVVNCDLTVVYANGAYVYVYDGTNYGLIYKNNLGLEAGDVIAAGWDAQLSIYSGLYEIVPQGDLTKSEAAPKAAKPTPVDAEDAEMSLAAYNMNRYFTLKGVAFAEATPAGKSNFTGMMGETEVPFRNNFEVASVEAGTYDVTGFLGVYNTGIQFYPISYDIPVIVTVCENIAALAELTEEQAMNVQLNLADAKVTYYAAAYGAYFVEDATGAIMLATFDAEGEPAEVEGIARGKAITGSAVGMYAEGSFGCYATDVDVTASEDVDVTYGVEMTVADALNPANANKLVTFVASDDVTITVDEGMVVIAQGEDALYVMDPFYSFPEDYAYPENIEKVTGVIVNMGMALLAPRDPADIVEAIPAVPVKIDPNTYYNFLIKDTELYLSAGWQDNNRQALTLSLGEPGYEQTFKFVPVDGKEGLYNLIGLDGKALYAEGAWNFFWNDNPTEANLADAAYQFTVEPEVGFIYIKTKNEYVGSDGIWGWSKLYTDKGLDKAVKFIPVEVEPEFTVYFDNSASQWETVYAYVWNGETNNAWPGVEMTQGENDLWSITFTEFEPENIIFNNGGNGKQTEDLVFKNGKTYVGEAPASPKELYLLGTINDWKPTMKFETADEVVYTLTVAEAIPAEAEFKIANADWSVSYTYDAAPIEPNVEYTFIDGNGGPGNAKVAAEIPAGATITFNAETLAFIIVAEIDGINAIDAEEGVEYYNMQGVRLAAPTIGKPCIRVANGVATKVIVK